MQLLTQMHEHNYCFIFLFLLLLLDDDDDDDVVVVVVVVGLLLQLQLLFLLLCCCSSLPAIVLVAGLLCRLLVGFAFFGFCCLQSVRKPKNSEITAVTRDMRAAIS